MAVDLWPYSGRSGGAVNDTEHEYLWAAQEDGVYPGQASNACQAGLSGSNWTVQPGRFRIAGHVLNLTTVQSGTLPSSSTATRRSLIVAYIDRTQSPWTYGVQLVPGSPGGGRPGVSQSRTGLYQVPLRAIDTATSGTTTLLADERVVLTPEGGGLLKATNIVPSQVPLLVIGAEGQTGDMISVRKQDGYRLLDVSEVGRVGMNTNGAPSNTGLHVKGAAAADTTLRLSAVTSQTGNLLQAVNAAGATVATIDEAGNLAATNFASSAWTTYTPTWAGTGSATFSTRTGRWKRIAQKTVAFRVYLKVGVAGSGSSTDVNFQLPTVPNRTIEWTFHGRTKGPGYLIEAAMFSGGSSTVVNEITMVNSSTTKNLTGDDLIAGMEVSLGGIYEEA